MPWANVSNAPFRLFKHYVHEGGISTPLVAHWPEGIKKHDICHTPTHVVDILPTLLDVAGASYLNESGGHQIQPMQGESFLGLFSGKDWVREQPIFFEHEGNSAVRHGQLKLVKQFGQDWELYDMEVDRTELNDLYGTTGTTEKKLAQEYQNWADKSGVLDWEEALPKLLKAWNIKSAEG